MKFKFGDIIINTYASDRNPLKEGIFVKEKSKTCELTDGKGKFWEYYKNDKGFILKEVSNENI